MQNLKLPLYYQFKTYEENTFQLLMELKECKEEESFCLKLAQILAINYGSEPRLINLKKALNREFIITAVPFMVDKTMEILKTRPCIALIIKQGDYKIKREFVFSLLSLSFFNLLQKQMHFSFPQRFNYIELFAIQQYSQIQVEKLKGHLNYFIQYTRNPKEGSISIQRLAFDPKYHGEKFGKPSIESLTLNLWQQSQQVLSKIVLVDKPIEHIQEGIIVDFADKKFGDFLFTRTLLKKKHFLFVNLNLWQEFSQQVNSNNCYDYNSYSGYRNTFKLVPQKAINKNQTILAIDAENYSRKKMSQFSKEQLLRDLNKAFIGFSQSKSNELKSISTGKWGCADIQRRLDAQIIITMASVQLITLSRYQQFNSHYIFFIVWREEQFRATQEYFLKIQKCWATFLCDCQLRLGRIIKKEYYDI